MNDSTKSNPMPKATVATTIRKIPSGLLNAVMIACLMFALVQAVNISTSLNMAKSLTPIGSLVSPFNLDIRYKYIHVQLS